MSKYKMAPINGSNRIRITQISLLIASNLLIKQSINAQNHNMVGPISIKSNKITMPPDNPKNRASIGFVI
ncbi:MAG: hypothetical protein R2730_08370 [Chitinophagales bacterium]